MALEETDTFLLTGLLHRVFFCDCMHTHAVANDNDPKFFKISFRIPKTPPIQPTSFGQYIKKLRVEKQLSQRDIARLLSVWYDSIRNWEKDRVVPRKDSMKKLTGIYQVDFDQYFASLDS